MKEIGDLWKQINFVITCILFVPVMVAILGIVGVAVGSAFLIHPLLGLGAIYCVAVIWNGLRRK